MSLRVSLLPWTVLLVAVATGCGEPVELERPPNLVLIVTDDQRWDSLDEMPELLDRIVERGTRFANAFATTPLCAPSRASILTGRLASDLGVLGLGGPDGGVLAFHDKGGVASTLPVWLQRRGYATGLFGKYINEYARISPAIPPGWDAWVAFVEGARLYYDYTLNENGVHVGYGADASEYSTDVLREHALDFIRDHADRPFFLYLAPFAPHVETVPADRHAGRFAGTPWPRPPGYREADLSDKPMVLEQLRELQLLLDGPDPEQATDARVAAHREAMLAVDDAVAAIDDLLARLGLLDDTVIVFTSDNGVAWGEHWIPGKDFPYEETLRIPLVMREGRGSEAPRTDERLVLNVDLAPTLAGMAGARVPAPVAGRDLRDDRGWRLDFASEYFGLFVVPAWTALREELWKYVVYETGEQELYDLALDPFELDNLLAGTPGPDAEQRAAAMAERLDELLPGGPRQPSREPGPGISDRLAAPR